MYTLAQQLKDEGRNEGRNEGKNEGKKEGKKEEKREIAHRMLLNNFSIEQVAAITGLSEKEVKGLMS